MKKLFLLAAVVVGMAGFASAEFRGIPTGPGSNLPTADYGGVDIATVSYSSANVRLFDNGGSIAWIHFSSAAAVTDFFIIRATSPVNSRQFLSGTSISGGVGVVGDYNTNNEVFRLYASTGLVGGTLAQGFTYTFPKPLRLPRGATFKSNVVTPGPITIGYTGFNK
jgi:hypothetical protein